VDNKKILLKKSLVILIVLLFLGVIIIQSTIKSAESLYYKKEFYNIIINSYEENNSPPYSPIPDIPDPAPIDIDICWYGGDPDPADNVTYYLYFGEFIPPPLFAIDGPYPANYTYICYDLEGLLEFATKYYLKIVAFDNHGANNSSAIWCITTEENRPPNPAFNPIPPDNATQVPLDAILYWNGSDPNSGDILTYDVYFGSNPDPPLVSQDQSKNWYDPYGSDNMPLYKDFYWRIVTQDMCGEEIDGPEWNFTTYIPWLPTTPEIDGPKRSRPGINYYYNFTIDDYYERPLSLLIDWDDVTDWSGPIEPGQTITVGHCWEKKGIYEIKARTMDEYGCESGTGFLEVTIPRNRVMFDSFIHWFLNRIPMLENLLNLLK